MRVLIAPEWYPWEDRPYFGRFCREQARTVAGEHDVAVLAWRVEPALRAPFRIEETHEDGVRTFRVTFRHVGVPKLDGVAKLSGCLMVLARLRRSGWRPDVIHAHEYEAGRTALMLRRLIHVPVVVSEHWSGFAVGELPTAERTRAREVFERADVVCSVSRDLEERLRRLAPAARFETVPNAVDTTIFHPDGSSPGDGRPLRLATVASLVEIKGHRYLLDAIALLARDRDVQLDLVGDGPLRADLAEHARALGVEGRVRFLGARSAAEIADMLRAADIFVLPSLWENLPCALIEAMACGLPAAATRVGGVPELVGEDAGVLVPPRSAQELAAGIAAVAGRLQDYDRRELAARAAARYGFDAVGRRWTQVYSTAVAAAST